MSGFTKAEKRQGKLRIAITGPSGSGKTYSALRLAKGIGGKIAVIDAENGSAADYADRFDFDMLELSPPYTVEKYLAALQAAYAADYDVVLVDGLSPAWAGEGGLLEKKERLDSRQGSNSFTNWGAITKDHEQLKAAILHNKKHLICTMRSKQDYILEQGKNGKQVPRKVGMAPIQRDGMEYEYTVCFDLAMDHSGIASKDRTSLYASGEPVPMTEDVGAALLKWRLSGAAEAVPAPVAATHSIGDPAPDPAPGTDGPSPEAKAAAIKLAFAESDAALMKLRAELDGFEGEDRKYLSAEYKKRQGELKEERRKGKEKPGNGQRQLSPDAEKLPDWAVGKPGEESERGGKEETNGR